VLEPRGDCMQASTVVMWLYVVIWLCGYVVMWEDHTAEVD